MRIADRLSQAEEDAVPRPYQLQLHLTDYCNLKCVFCPTKTLIPDVNLDQKNELTLHQWLDLIKQAVDFGVEEFHICGGGEPFFFHKKAMAVMSRIKDLGKRGEIINNGTLLRPESIQMLVRKGWDKVTFSVDGPTPEVHDFIRAGTSFELISHNIRRLADLKVELGVEKPQLCIHFVVCSLNYMSIPDMIPLCERLGVDTFLIQALNIWSEEINQYKLSPDQGIELRGILRVAFKQAQEAGISTNIQDFFRHDLFPKANVMDEAMVHAAGKTSASHPLAESPCFMPWYNLSVFADGRVLPCFILRDPGVSFKEHSLEDIWKSGYFKELREEMRSKRLRRDCAKCNPWTLPKTQEIREALNSMMVITHGR